MYANLKNHGSIIVASMISYAVLLYVIWTHVLWRDEAQALMIAVHSSNLHQLFSHMGYEGTPGLWHLLLWLGKFLPPLVDIKLLTSLAIGLIVYIVFFQLSLKWYMALMYSWGFLLIEYALLERSYTLSILFLVVFCCYEKKWRRNNKRYYDIALTITLFLLTQTNVHSDLVAAGLVVYLGLANLLKLRPVSWTPVIGAVAGAAVAVWQVFPAPDLGVGAGWYFENFFVRFFDIWPGVILINILPLLVKGILSSYGRIMKIGFYYFFLAILVLSLFTKIFPARFKVCCISIAIVTVMFATLGIVKYHLEELQVYIIFTMAFILWLIEFEDLSSAKNISIVIFSVLLGLQVVNSFANINYILKPYSASQEIAIWLDDNYKYYVDEGRVAVFPDQVSETLSTYLNCSKGLYATTADRYETYTPWDKKEYDITNAVNVPKLGEHIPGTGDKSYLLITYYQKIVNANGLKSKSKLIKKFTIGSGLTWPCSKYAYVYLIR